MNSKRSLTLSLTAVAVLCIAGSVPAASADAVPAEAFPMPAGVVVYFGDGEDRGPQGPEVPATVSFGNPDDEQDSSAPGAN